MSGMPATNAAGECLCITCAKARSKPFDPATWFADSANRVSNFRYACEICGNKRCPHHTDHNLACTDSNETGQKGSVYE